MTIVEEIVATGSLKQTSRVYRRDLITLSWEDRRRGHGRRRSESGLEFGISLPGGTVLKEGDCFVLEDEMTVIEVREALEAVYVVRPNTPREWAFYAYHVGNRHQSLMIGDAELIFLQSPAVRSLLEHLGATFSEDRRAFTATLVGQPH